MSEPKIDLQAPIPESLWNCAQDFLATHPSWDQERMLTAALALWLMQNGGDRRVSRIYLDSIFQHNNP